MSAPEFPGIHLPGSMPQETGEELFDFIGAELEPWLRRVPDETGDRRGWIGSQLPALAGHPAFEMRPPDPASPIPAPQVGLRDDVDRDALEFDTFMYGPAAQRSYELFVRAREDGKVRSDSKLLVTMPTPHNVVALFVVTDDQPAVLAAYERETQRTIERISAAIPHRDLAIQWDLVGELSVWTDAYQFKVWTKEFTTAAIARISSWVPDDVELGYHLCFGDSNNAILLRPRDQGGMGFERTAPADARPLVVAAEILARSVDRPINFIHMANAVEWASAEPYAPLRDLRLCEDTELFLGVVHHNDGLDGAHRRMELASEVIDGSFGIATECGMGRYEDEQKFYAAIQTLQQLASELEPAATVG